MAFRFIYASILPITLLSGSMAPCAPTPVKPTPKQAATAKPTLPAREMLYATGEGAMANAKEQPNRAKAYLEAKAFAKMAAIASVVQIAKGTLIEYSAKGEDYVADTLIKQEIKGVLDSVQVVSVSKRSVEKDIIVAVTVRAPKPIPQKAPVPTPQPATPKTPPPFRPSWVAGNPTCSVPQAADGYTSVIIDAQGLGVCRCMSPRILRPDGSEVWGTMKSDYDLISDYGIVAYANSRADACLSRRAGERPLIVRALCQGRSATNGDVIISSEDARALEAANSKNHFLDDYRVIVIVDRVNSLAGMKANP